MMIAVGDKHFINSDYIVEILYPVDRRANRLAQIAAGNQRLINAAGGERVRSIIRLKGRFTVLSALEVKTLKSKIQRACLCAVPASRIRLRDRHKITSPRGSKLSDKDDRRLEPDRRKFSYTHHIPERRSGTERRKK